MALVGENGACKSTIVKILTGIYQPEEGEIRFNGAPIRLNSAQDASQVGITAIHQETVLFDDLSVAENIFLGHAPRSKLGLIDRKAQTQEAQSILRSIGAELNPEARLGDLGIASKHLVAIARALSIQAQVVILDEPTAGVDVELRKDMWKIVNKLRNQGVTIILTTHYIEEAEEIADRVGVISNGELLLVEKKDELMQSLGKKQLVIDLKEPVKQIPSSLEEYNIELNDAGTQISYTYVVKDETADVSEILNKITNSGLLLKDLKVEQRSQEDIFVDLVMEE